MSDEIAIDELLKYLPHRYPFLLVDRVTAFTAGQSLTAIKNVSYNEPFFQGHFPIKPVFPGVLVIEAMAQATALLSFRSRGGYPPAGELCLLVGIDKARFKHQVIPGDQLQIDVSILRGKKDIWRYQASASVADTVVCTAELMSAYKKVAD